MRISAICKQCLHFLANCYDKLPTLDLKEETLLPALHCTVGFCFWTCWQCRGGSKECREILMKLQIWGCPNLRNISHIPNIRIHCMYVQRDGQLPDSIDSEMHDDVVEVDKIEDSNHEEDDGAGFEADELVVEINIDEGDL